MRASNLLFFTGLSAMVATFVACSDDETTNPTTSTTTASGTGGNGGDGGEGTGATGGTGTTTSTGGAGGAGGGVGGAGGAGGAGGSGGSMEQAIHGCTSASAEDLTGMATVNITGNGNMWEIGHSRCILVSTGTTVIWSGNFVAHPLRGGEQPTPDLASPIDVANPVVNTTTVLFTATGAFPYFCEAHPVAMNGVVYVQ